MLRMAQLKSWSFHFTPIPKFFLTRLKIFQSKSASKGFKNDITFSKKYERQAAEIVNKQLTCYKQVHSWYFVKK